jgi:hypothetical protein
MEPSANAELEARRGRGWCSARRWALHQRWTTLHWKLYHKESFPKREATLAILSLFAAVAASAQSTTGHLPITDAEKVADALRAAPNFITDDATIVDYPASKGGEFRVLRQGSTEWTCLPGPTPGSQHDDPGCFDKVFFQFVKDVLAGRPQHVERLGIAYMYTGHTVPGAAGGQFRVGAHIMLVSPHPEDLQGFTRYGWNGTYVIHLPGSDQPSQWFLVIPIQADSERQ